MHEYYSNHDIAVNPITFSQTKKVLSPNESSKSKQSSLGYSIMLSASLSILALFVISVLGFLFLRNISIATVDVSGDVKFANEELLEMIAVDLPAFYFAVDSKAIAARFETHPLVYSAKVQKTISGKLTILLERSAPIVGVLAQVQGIQVPSYFDKNGRCVQVGVGAGIVDVPILSGLELIEPQVGVYLPNWLKGLMLGLSTIKQEDATLYNRISEMVILDKGDDYRVLQISFVGYSTSFISELQLHTEKLRAIWALQNDIERSHLDEEFDSFDIRQGVIIGKKAYS